MRNVSDKRCGENQNKHFVFNIFFFENHAVYVLKWKYILERGRPLVTIWRMRAEYRISKATHIYLQYTILIAFPQQQ